MLAADNVSFAYGTRRVLHGCALRVGPGSLVGLLGPNGSGKTTLLALLAGTRRPAEGRVTLDGVPLERLPRARLARRIAVVPQETHLAFDYTVLEIALMGRYPHLGPFELEGPADLALARAALAATGTADLERRSLSTLSGGEKQRVVIASALAQFGERDAAHPAGPGGVQVLLLDEPTASLDLGYQLDVARLLARLNRERGIAIVVSTHDLNLAAGLCREIVLLRDGRVLAAGPTDEVLTPARIRELYGVDVDVQRHPGAGHVVVVPIGRTGGPPPPATGGAAG